MKHWDLHRVAKFMMASNGFCRSDTAEGRMKESLQNGEGISVSVQLKQFAKTLQSCQLTSPSELYCGIAEDRGHVHFVFVYRSTDNDGANSDDINLSYKVPVLEEGWHVVAVEYILGTTWTLEQSAVLGVEIHLQSSLHMRRRTFSLTFLMPDEIYFPTCGKGPFSQ